VLILNADTMRRVMLIRNVDTTRRVVLIRNVDTTRRVMRIRSVHTLGARRGPRTTRKTRTTAGSIVSARTTRNPRRL